MLSSRFFTLGRTAALLTTRREGQLLLNRQCVHQNNKQKLLADFNYYLNSGSQSDTILIQCIKACADGLLSEQPQKRIWLADNMVKKVKESGLESNVQIKNSLLQVYLQNHHKFSPSLFLQDMKDENILPNRGTMFLLLRGYCQQGNMEGAKGILQEIQVNNIPINEEVYASLITCHAMCNEMNEARELLQVMKDSGLEPKQTAYSALLSGYAYHGDLESVQRTIDEMRSQRVYAGHSMYVEMLDALSRGGQSSRMKELLGVIRNKQWMYNDLLEKTQVFAGRGDMKSTLCLLECLLDIKTIDDSSGPLVNTAAIALRLLTISDRPLTDLLPSLSLFQKVGLSLKECYEILVWKCFDTKNWTDLQQVLNMMHSEGTPVKSFYLYPPFAGCGGQKDIEGIMHWLSVCKSFNIPMDRNIFMFCMKAFNDDFNSLFTQLLERGLLAEEGTLPCIVEFLCIQKRLANLEHLCAYISQQPPEKLPIAGLLGAITKVIQVGPNFYEFFSTVINTLLSLPLEEEAFQKLRGLVHFGVSRVVHSCGPNDAMKIVRSFLEKDPNLVCSDTSRLVMSILNNRGFTKELFEFIKMLQLYKVEFGCAQHRVIIKMASRVPNSASIALASYDSMKQQGCVLDESVYTHMISALVKGQRSGLALSFYNQLISRNMLPSLAAYSILVRSLLVTGQFPAALKIRSEMEAAGITPNVSMHNMFIEAYGRRGDVEKCRQEFQLVKEKNEHTYQSLMVGYCYHGDVVGATGVFEEARSTGVNGTKRMASILLETYLNGRDLEGAVSLLDKFDDVQPDFNSCARLVNECEEAKRRDLTEKSLNFITSLGLSKIDVDCVFTFAMMKSGQFDEAMKSMESKNYSRHEIGNAVKYYLSEINKVENYLTLGINLLDHFDIDSVSVYTDLVKSYADSRHFLIVKKALEKSNKTLSDSFLALFKKENITPETKDE